MIILKKVKYMLLVMGIQKQAYGYFWKLKKDNNDI